MDAVLIELTNKKAIRLLHDMEELNLIKVIKGNSAKPTIKLSEKYAGKLPSAVANELQNYVGQSRNKWNKDLKVVDPHTL